MIIPKVYTEVIYYVLIPLFISIMIFGLLVLITSRKSKAQNDPARRYKINYWSSIVGIIFGAILLTVSIGFSVAFIEKLYTYNLAGTYSFVIALLAIFPILPLGFLIYSIVVFIKTIKHRNDIVVEVE